MTISKTLSTAAVAALFALSGAAANAVTLVFDASSSSTNDPATMAFGTAELSFSDVSDGLQIEVTVTNTSDEPSELISFGFDLIGEFVSFTSGGNLDSSLTGSAASFPGNITVDFCATSQNSCQSGGKPDGLSVGESDTFFVVTNSGPSAATAEDDYTALFFDNQPFATGANSEPTSVLRFQSVGAAGGSETRFNPSNGLIPPPPSPSEVPLPAAGWMLLAGVAGLAGLKRRKRTA